MPTQDTSKIKEDIINIVRIKGPSLPVHIAKEIGMSILFTSAFLSELISERRIKISNMKVGSSSIHFLEGQEQRLENFAQHLKSREKDAFSLLRGKKFLIDSEQEPAIRVALRAIKDFAIPFERDNKIIWRYFIVPESEFQEKTQPQKIQLEKQELDIFDKDKSKRKIRKTIQKTKKKNDKFFNKVKEFLSAKSIEILDIEEFSKNELTLRIRLNEREQLLIAYNKKRINENDIIKASKKASEFKMGYIILSLGEPLKKISNLIKAIKNLSGIEKVE